MKLIAAGIAALAFTPAWASHPLISEDTSVTGKGGWELEQHGSRSRDEEGGVSTRGTELLVKLGYGITDTADVEVEVPYLRETSDGAVAEWRGDASLSAKWRFYERGGWSFVLKPSLLFPGWAANLAAAYETGPWEFLAHLGYTDNRTAGERRSLWHASAAALYRAAKRLRLALDYGADSDPDPAGDTPGRALVVGAIYEWSQRVELGLGVLKGLNDAADDRSLRARMKLRW